MFNKKEYEIRNNDKIIGYLVIYKEINNNQRRLHKTKEIYKLINIVK